MEVTLNSRSRSILMRLLESDGPLAVAGIAEGLNLTARMVRYQLDDIENWLARRKAKLLRRPGRGVWIEHNGECAELAREVRNAEHYQSRLSEAERTKLMRLAFLAQARSQTTSELGALLGVSKTTVAKDLKQVRAWFQRRGLFLKGTPGLGVTLVGDEVSWRRAMIDAVFSGRKQSYPVLIEDLGHNALLDAYHKEDLGPIERAVDFAESALGIRFSDAMRVQLALKLAVTLKRLRLGRQVRLVDSMFDALRRKKEFVRAQEIAAMLERATGVDMPEAEICYFTAHLLAADALDAGGIGHFDRDHARPGFEPYEVAGKIIYAAERALGLSFADPEAHEAVAALLVPAFYRLKFGISWENPLTQIVKARFAEFYAATQIAAEEFLLYTGMDLSEDDLGALTMLMAAANERKQRPSGRPVVVLVVSGGSAEMDLLNSRVLAEFPQIEVLKTCSYAEFSKASFTADLVVSVDEIACNDLPVVVVSPLLLEDEVRKLRLALFCQDKSWL